MNLKSELMWNMASCSCNTFGVLVFLSKRAFVGWLSWWGTIRPKLRNPVKDAGDHMPALLNLFNEEAHSPFSILLKLREYCPSPTAMSLSPALLGNTEASRVWRADFILLWKGGCLQLLFGDGMPLGLQFVVDRCSHVSEKMLSLPCQSVDISLLIKCTVM